MNKAISETKNFVGYLYKEAIKLASDSRFKDNKEAEEYKNFISYAIHKVFIDNENPYKENKGSSIYLYLELSYIIDALLIQEMLNYIDKGEEFSFVMVSMLSMAKIDLDKVINPREIVTQIED